MKKIILILIIIVLALELIIIYNQKKDIGLHHPSECMEINEDIYCRIARVVEE